MVRRQGPIQRYQSVELAQVVGGSGLGEIEVGTTHHGSDLACGVLEEEFQEVIDLVLGREGFGAGWH